MWTRLVKSHRFCRRRHWPWPTESPLKAHFKKRFPWHSQTVQALVEKFSATIDGVRTKRKNGDKEAHYPWRFRRYFNPIFKGQAGKMEGQHLLLPRGRGRDPIRVHLPEAMPPGTMVQAELGYGEISLTVTHDIPDPVPAMGGKAGALDIGVIHLDMVSDGHESLAISWRGLRSVKQGRAKAQAKLRKKRARTKPGPRRRKRLNQAQHRTRHQVERVTRNALHHAANPIVVFCVADGMTISYAGDLGTLNHQKRHRRSRRANQEVGALEFGRLEQYLEYKLRRHGLQLIKMSEAYTSQTCPRCGHLTQGGRPHRPLSRLWLSSPSRRGRCGRRHPEHGEIRPGEFLVPPRLTYRRPVPLKGTPRRSPAEPRHVAGGKSGASHQGLTARGRSHRGSPRISVL